MIDYKTGALIGACTDEEMLDALRAVRDEQKFQPRELGICGGVDLYFDEQGKLVDSADGNNLRDLMSLWPKSSGHRYYPVPPVLERHSASDAFHECIACWDKNTEYGQLRLELLDFCIQRLEDRIYEDKVS